MNLDDEQNDLFGSDSEDDEVNDNKSKNTTMNDIFGESDSNNEEEALESQNNTTTVSNEDGPSMRDIFGDMDDDNDNTFPDKKNGELDDIFGSNNKDEENNLPIQSYIFIPKIPKFNEDDSHIILRMPNFMKIKANPYDPKTYNPQRELESCGHASCVVRWRYVLDNDGMQILDENGRPKMESNAKLVKFSDGTYQVIVGQDVYDASLTRHNDSFVYSHLRNDEDNGYTLKEGENSEVSCLEGVGAMSARMTLKPESVTSKSHELMSQLLSEKYQKQSKLKERGKYSVKTNPYLELEMRAKLELDELKKERKRRSQSENEQSRYSMKASMSSNFLEQGYDNDARYDSTSIAAIKGKKPTSMAPPPVKRKNYTSSYDDERENSKFSKKSKSIELRSDNEDDDDDEGEIDSEMEDFIVKDDNEDNEDEEDEGSYDGSSSNDSDGEGDEDDDESDGSEGVVDEPENKKKSKKSNSKSNDDEKKSKKDSKSVKPAVKNSIAKRRDRSPSSDDSNEFKPSRKASEVVHDKSNNNEKQGDDENEVIKASSSTSISQDKKRNRRLIEDDDE